MKSTRVTASADVKAMGGAASIYKIVVQNNGTAGAAGNVEIRDAVAAAGDTGTLRYDIRFASADEDAAGVLMRNVDFMPPLDMPRWNSRYPQHGNTSHCVDLLGGVGRRSTSGGGGGSAARGPGGKQKID